MSKTTKNAITDLASGDSITCPRCSHSFEPSTVLRTRITSELQKQFDTNLARALAKKDAQYDAAVKEKEDELARATKDRAKLLAEKRTLQEIAKTQAAEVESRVTAEAERVRLATEKQIRDLLGRENRVALAAKEAEIADTRAKLLEAGRQEAAFLRKSRALDEERRSLELTLEKTLAAERDAMRRQIEAQTEERFALKAVEAGRAKETELADVQARLARATELEIELRKRAGELEDAQRRAAAETLRLVQEEGRNARLEIEKEATSARSILEVEHRLRIEQATATIKELQQKLAQGSQQTQGEAQEIALRDVIEQAFRHDVVTDVAIGAEGADLVQAIHDDDGRAVASILWESKRTKKWSDTWLAKVRDDMREAGAACAILVTQAMPPRMASFGEREGVWICSLSEAAGLATVLRHGLLEVALARRAATGHSEKTHLLYAYVTGPEFRSKMSGAVDVFREMQGDLLREQRSLRSSWRKREWQIQRAATNVMGFYGDVRGIAGRELAPIEELELPEPSVRALEPGVQGEANAELVELLYDLIPATGSIGNGALSERFREEAADRFGLDLADADYEQCRVVLLTAGRISKGRGRGGSVFRCASAEAAE